MKKYLLVFFFLEIFLVGVLALTSNFAAAQTTDLTNPLKFTGGIELKTPEEVVVAAIAGFAAILAFVAIAFTVFSGFKLIIATNEDAIKSARTSLTWAVGGFIVAFLSFTIVASAANFLGFRRDLVVDQDQIQNPIRGPVEPGSFVSVMYFIMSNFLGIIGVATILMIVYYGYMYITSSGNEEAVEKAKTGLKWSLLGFVITILAYTIVNAVQTAFFF